MAQQPDRIARTEALGRWKSEQRASARAVLPLSNEDMQDLFDMLDIEFPREGCDHTLRLTQQWLVTNGHEVEPVVKWLHDNGGFCDCEALANAEQAWLDAIQDKNE